MSKKSPDTELRSELLIERRQLIDALVHVVKQLDDLENALEKTVKNIRKNKNKQENNS